MEFNIEETWCFTGHRPNKLHGYNKLEYGNLILQGRLEFEIFYLYKVYGIKNFISGMADGWDMMAADAVLNLKNLGLDIKLICAIPYIGHGDYKYDWILEQQADYVHLVSNRQYFNNCLQRRNEWMVNNSVGQLACFDGSKGGTKNCLDYADKQKKNQRIIIHPKSFRVRRFIDVNA